MGRQTAPTGKQVARDELVRRALERTNWDLIACSMPSNVLLLTGYWPAAGYSLALATRQGQILLIVPDDEDEFAEQSWADEVATYCPVPLDRMMTAEEPVLEAFLKAKEHFELIADRIGIDQAESYEAPGYAPAAVRGSAARAMRRAFPSATLAPADELLAELRAVKTSAEVEHVRTACDIAGRAFREGLDLLRPGLTETEIAVAFRAILGSCLADFDHVHRCDGFAYCMSGPNSARAAGLYSRSRARTLAEGDLVILRVHVYADGYWADVVRTCYMAAREEKQPGGTKRQMYDAVYAARDAALQAIRPGTRASELDRIARAEVETRGLAGLLKHSVGHGAGFGIFDPTARPRLHPKSEDILEPGMILKLDPGLYDGSDGGVRKTDIVAVTESGPEVLTGFHWNMADIVVHNTDRAVHAGR